LRLSSASRGASFGNWIATELRDLAAPPGNRLEALRGERKGQHSIRINDQWRLGFVWREGNAYEVEIVDYH
jgi:proteic killer suppression protein